MEVGLHQGRLHVVALVALAAHQLFGLRRQEQGGQGRAEQGIRKARRFGASLKPCNTPAHCSTTAQGAGRRQGCHRDSPAHDSRCACPPDCTLGPPCPLPSHPPMYTSKQALRHSPRAPPQSARPRRRHARRAPQRAPSGGRPQAGPAPRRGRPPAGRRWWGAG